MNVLLGVTGSVAAKLTRKMQTAIQNKGHEVKIILTNSAKHFTDYGGCYTDLDEWLSYTVDDRVVHIELSQWADAFVIAPCTANTLAKLANGLCDNLLTSCARAWDYKKKMIIAPAMNTQMYLSVFTERHTKVLKELGVEFVDPQPKELFCGDVGIGALARIEDIVAKIE